MKIEVRQTRTPLRRWHLVVLDRLSALPDVDVCLSSDSGTAAEDTAGSFEPLLDFQRRLHRRPPGLSSRVKGAAAAGYRDGGGAPADLVIDLGPEPLSDERVWRLDFDAEPGESAALTALSTGRTPLVSLLEADTVLAAGRPGSETPGLLVAAFDDLLARCVTLIVQTVRGAPPALPAVLPREPATPAPPTWRKVATGLAGAVVHRGYRTLYRAPHWRVGWRFVDGTDLIDEIERPSAGWHDLPDDGRHFYADPFPFVHDDRLYLFVEDFEHRVGRGVISVVEFGENGPLGRLRPVLEHHAHLSYPFVIHDEGEIFMIPETTEARTVELYRATSFPDEWTRVAVLLSGLEASDATVFSHDGRWWMTATVRDGGSFSDALHLWSATSLVGPWRPHAGNPVMIDISSARPAGRVVSRNGRLLRPVQDGRAGYGTALAVAEITRLDDEQFDQRVIGRIGPGPWWPGRRLHTLNRAGNLECIDGSAMSPRFWPSSRSRRSRPGS